MSKVQAGVTKILGDKQLHIVEFEHFGYTLAMTSLELPNIGVGSQVILSVKSSNVGISKNELKNVSFSNRLKAKIAKIDMGNLLSVVKLKLSSGCYIDALITTKSAQELDLKIGDEAYALFKASELSIQEVFS